MREWRAGDLMCIAAGTTIVIAAFLPWAQVEGSRFYALQMRMYAPFAFAVASGAALVVFGSLRSLWGGAAGLAGAFAVTVVVLWMHTDVYAGLEVLRLPAGIVGPHVSGYGEYALFAAGILAGAAGVVTVVQREPPLSTHPSRALPGEGPPPGEAEDRIGGEISGGGGRPGTGRHDESERT